MSESGLDSLIKEKLIQLHGKIETIKQIKQAKGEDFNLFSVLEMERLEVETHSKFIYELINPRGSHHQGELYLRLFLSEALGLNDFGEIKNVERESLAKNNRRIDFAIETEKYQIGIEMKIDAGDQKSQLKDYYDELKKRAKTSKTEQEVILYYLTLDGSEASDKSDGGDKDKYTRISFWDNIARWIEVCIEKSVMLPSIRESLVQYGNLIKNLTGQTTKEIQMEVEKIISTPEMAEAATALTQNIGFIWAKREVIFWQKLINMLKGHIANVWKVLLDEDYRKLLYNESGDLLDISTAAKNIDGHRKEKNNDIEIQLNRSWSGHEIYLRVYAYNIIHRKEHGIYCYLDKIKGLSTYNNLAKELGLKYTGGSERFGPLGIKVNFYGKGVSEPTYELFDDEKLEEFVENTQTAILKKLEIIDEYLDA